MLTRIYIEALLANEELADQVWEAWDAGEIDDSTAWLAWMLIASVVLRVIQPFSFLDCDFRQSFLKIFVHAIMISKFA